MLIANIIDTPTEISIDTTRDKVVSLAAITSVTYEITERSHTKIVNFLPVLSNSFETHGVHPETAQVCIMQLTFADVKSGLCSIDPKLDSKCTHTQPVFN
jgi:hypothetical protein